MTALAAPWGLLGAYITTCRSSSLALVARDERDLRYQNNKKTQLHKCKMENGQEIRSFDSFIDHTEFGE
ncbi:hypothetical protein NDU88_011178 [Pleurodeles waltl]|uniref:Secreted protein n=1 Tax=Pleurodeles waltl TaxID=8319 RepID=A0AAV7PZX5_PLEWA|nr:hypothetical protein NDU88_011178 [Pleurodeles waltl]